MNLGRYGPFANVVGIASALVATFSVLLLKTFGGVKRWTWLTSGSPPFLVTAAARILTVALMAATYVTIDKSNYRWFVAVAVLSGVLAFAAIARFERLRRLYVAQIPQVGRDGKALTDRNNRPLYENIVIGLESELRPDAKGALAVARKQNPALSLLQFFSGSGHINDPGALWDGDLLANRASSLTITLMWILLLGVITLFWSAFVIEVAPRA